MLKLTGISMLTGLLALLAGIYLSQEVRDGADAFPALNWNAATVRVESGSGRRSDGQLHLRLNASGQGVIALPISRAPASAFPYLHLDVTPPPGESSVLLLWRTAETRAHVHVHTLPTKAGTPLWLDTRGLQAWSGTLTSLGIMVTGQAGATVTFSDVSLRPASLSAQLQSIYAGWTSLTPWHHAAINTHRGLGPTATTFYPVPVFAAALALSIAAYLVILVLPWTRQRFDWRAVSLMFLACWIGLDFIWQKQLFHQLALTYDTFSGKDSDEKLEAGIDGDIVAFMTRVKKEIASPDAQIFVSSADDYLGMRGAYYLYPLNVYWERKGPELPPQKYVHDGDYIVVVEPAGMHFDAQTGVLRSRSGTALQVEPVLSRHVGSLYRVK